MMSTFRQDEQSATQSLIDEVIELRKQKAALLEALYEYRHDHKVNKCEDCAICELADKAIRKAGER